MRSPLWLLAILMLHSILYAQSNDEIERHAQIVRDIAGYTEGYGQIVSGDLLQYPRLRPALSTAMICRSNQGSMAIEWKTAAPVSLPPGTDAGFVVSAGIAGQEESAVTFHVAINGVQRFTFHPTTSASWGLKGNEGGMLAFDGVLRDQFNDHFGYLRFVVPGSWIRPGEPVAIRITADRSPTASWMMVYQDASVIDYLKGKVQFDAYCACSITGSGANARLSIIAASTWIGRAVRLRAGSRPEVTAQLTDVDHRAGATLAGTIVPDEPLEVWVEKEEIVRVRSLAQPVDESLITPKRLIQRTASKTPAGAWKLDYRTTYLPDFGGALTDLSKAMNGLERGYIISSSHQDIAWMDTPEECIKARDEKIITPALALLREIPAYRFDLEDVLELREYIGRHPDRKAEIGKYIADGRLGIGASFNMPYEDLCSGEMLVRQFYAGKRWLQTNFPGCDSRVAWNPDVPGRAGQMPQVMAKAGVPALIVSRQERGLYTWKSYDSSSITVFSPGHYALFIERTLGKPFHEGAGFLASFSREWASGIHNGTRAIPVLSMSDMSAPINYGDMIHTWNSLSSITTESGDTQPLHLPALQYATAAGWLEQVSKEGRTFPEIRGERPNIWLYIHGPTHHWAIDAKREADTYLAAAETFSTIHALLARTFAGYPATRLTAAWEAQLYPDHGWGGKNGDVTDSTFLSRYRTARDISKEIYGEATTEIARMVRTDRKGGIPVVVFNRLSWTRTGAVTCTVNPEKGMFKKGVGIRAEGGKEIPVQVSRLERFEDGSVRSAEITFVAAGVPSIGYATYRVVGGTAVAGAQAQIAAPATLENKHYRIALAPGGVEQITDKKLGKKLLARSTFLGGELFTMQSVGEDAGEWADPQFPTMEGFDKMSAHASRWTVVERGPVRDVVELRQPIEHTTVVQRITLYHGLKQVDFATSLLAWDGTHYREFRLAFPVNVNKGTIAYEAPFETVEIGKDEMRGAPGERYTSPAPGVRPRTIQNWISASDSDLGITLSSSVAVWDYRNPTDSTDTGTLLQPILMASRKSCNWEGNWYPQTGDHDFRFSLSSHTPGWRNGRRFGVEANTPLTAVVLDPRQTGGTLPVSQSFLSVDADNIVVSALKKAEDSDDVILRLYEAERKNTQARVVLPFKAKAASSTNIIEQAQGPLNQSGNRIVVPVGHQAIETYRLVVE